MDNELFELCKGVYEATGWGSHRELSMWCWVEAHQEYEIDNGTMLDEEHPPYPLYTSDYLLEKLLPITRVTFYRMRDGMIAVFFEPKRPIYDEIVSDTPLKALLKLTIALDEANELTK